MRGTNKVEKAIISDGALLRVHEIFYTLQGEMPFAGTPAVFIRLSGCNLRCSFCDTDFEGVDQEMSVDAIINEVLSVAQVGKPRLVVITGGEPLRQNIGPLTRSVNNVLDIPVQVETAGTLPLQGFAPAFFGSTRNTIVCSPKTPQLCRDLLPFIEVYRYVLRASEPVDEQDGLPLRSTQIDGVARIARPHDASVPVFVSPCDEADEVLTALNYEYAALVAMRYGYRLSLQTHKIVSLP